jgi:Na+/melibiose symporter-like transporter
MLGFIFQGTAIMFLNVWERISKRWGKQRVYITGALIWTVG